MDSTPRIDRVVLGFDGSAPSQAALRAAIEEAGRRRVPLMILTAIDVGALLPLNPAVYSAAARAAVEGAASEARGELGDGRVEARVEIGYPSSVLLRLSREHDLIVVGTHGHRPVARVLLGSTSTAVATHSTCPVLVVRWSRPDITEPRVVVGVDGSAASSRAIQLAADEADRLGARLHAVLALPPVLDRLGVASALPPQELQDAERLLSECLSGIQEQHPDVEVESDVVHLDPVDALMRAAQGAGLLVLGTRGHGPVASVLLGSVSRRLLQRAPCPVAVVPPQTPVGSSEGRSDDHAIPAAQ